MFDRIFLPALTFVVLVAAASAFAADAVQSGVPLPVVVRLDTVTVVAQRELPATPVALAAVAAATAAQAR